MKRSFFLASGLALTFAPSSILRAGNAQTVVRVFDGNAVSTIPIEQYLYGVVAREMPVSWPAAALQAQAICARTYVLQRSDPAKPYDVVPSETNQVYGGIASESPAATAAVDATTGKVLRFGPAIAKVTYSACCGGRTESSADAWGTLDLPYLHSEICPWCTASPDYRWTRIVSSDDIMRAFPTNDPSGFPTPDPVGVIQNVRIDSADNSGRAREILIIGTKGSVAVSASAFRQRIGTRIVRSLYIQRITAAQSTFSIEGAGYGHGVGLCQWGAKGMALAGHTTEDILNFYFPGTAITNG